MKKLIVAAVLVGFSALAQAQQQRDPEAAGAQPQTMERRAAEARSKGVDHYHVTEFGQGAAMVDLVASSGDVLGQARVIRLKGDTLAVTFQRPGESALKMRWDSAAGTFDVIVDGVKASKRFDFKKFEWTTEGAAYLFDTKGKTIELATAVMTDVRGGGMLGKSSEGGPMETNWVNDWVIDDGTLGTSCAGPTVRGTGAGDGRSNACRLATVDANTQCSNVKCIGCCRLLDCDAVCAVGDYVCYAGRSGDSCGTPPPPPRRP